MRQWKLLNLSFDKSGSWSILWAIVGDAFMTLRVITNRIYWNKKVKIAILALATFIAMC
jgi:hypothetical protein